MAGLAVQLCLSLTRRIMDAAQAARHNKKNVAQARPGCGGELWCTKRAR
jgi:hypothetical protein